MKKILVIVFGVMTLGYFNHMTFAHSAYNTTQTVKDKPASFKHGNLNQYIANHLDLTTQEIGQGGEALIQIVVTKDGSIGGVKFLKSYSKIVDAKIYDVVRTMNDWTPAYKDGVAVESYHTVPIKFESKKK